MKNCVKRSWEKFCTFNFQANMFLRFLGSNLLTRSSVDEDDDKDIELILVYELADGNLEKYLFQRSLTLTGYEAFQGCCCQLATGLI